MQTDSVTFLQLTPERYQQELLRAAQLGAHKALQLAGLPVREFYTRTEMQRRHGKREIDELIRCNRLTPHRLPATDDNTTKRVVYSETEYLLQII